MSYFKAPSVNFFSTTLNGAINTSVDTITLNSVTGLQAPGVIIIDREDGLGVATPNAREVVSFTGIAGSDLTGCTRNVDGSGSRSHSSGALVETTLTVGMWNELRDPVATALTTNGAGILLTGTATIANIQLSNSVNASGASIVGVFPSGASGSLLMSRGNATTPVFASSAVTSVWNIVLDGGGLTLATGVKLDIIIPYNCTITSVTALADQTGSVVVDIWEDPYADYPPTDADSITASAPVTISTGIKSQDSTLTGWTTALTAGATLRFNVDSVTSITRVVIGIAVTR